MRQFGLEDYLIVAAMVIVRPNPDAAIPELMGRRFSELCCS